MSDARHSLEMRVALLAHKWLRVPVGPAAFVDGEFLDRCESDAGSSVRHWPALAACLVGALLVHVYVVLPLYLAYCLPLIAGPIYDAVADLAVALGLDSLNGAAVATPVAWLIVLATALIIAGVLLSPYLLVLQRSLMTQKSLVSLALAVERDRSLPSSWREYPKCGRKVRALIGRRTYESITRPEVLTGASS